jgi:chaperonin GroEL
MAVEAAPEVSATETAVVEKPADQDEDHGHGHHHGHAH